MQITNDINEIKNKFDIKKYDNPFYKIMGLKIDGHLIGYLSYFLIYDRIEIEYVFIDEYYRKKGYATYLFDELFLLAKENKCINITLEVNVKNKNALKLYEKLGFKKVALKEKYYENSDGYLMLKEL